MKTIRIKRLIIIVFAISWMESPGNTMQDLQEQNDEKKQTVKQDVPEGWESLFDGETLTGWRSVPYGGEGKPYVRNGSLILPEAMEGVMTGVRWVGRPLPENNYEIYYEARRLTGDDIFAGLSFPYGDTAASLIMGGWRNSVNGLSSIDGLDALENETSQFFSLRDNQWYKIELRVTTDSIQAFIGSTQIVDLETKGKAIHLRDMSLDTGLTFWTYLSTGEIRNVRIRKIQ